MQYSINNGTPMTNRRRKSTSTSPCFSSQRQLCGLLNEARKQLRALLIVGSATSSWTRVGPSGFPYAPGKEGDQNSSTMIITTRTLTGRRQCNKEKRWYSFCLPSSTLHVLTLACMHAWTEGCMYVCMYVSRMHVVQLHMHAYATVGC